MWAVRRALWGDRQRVLAGGGHLPGGGYPAAVCRGLHLCLHHVLPEHHEEEHLQRVWTAAGHRRSVSDPGSDAVPCWLGFRQGAAVLWSGRGSLPGRAVYHGLGLLHSHGRHRAHLHLRCVLSPGRDRHVLRQGAGGDRGRQEPNLPALRWTRRGGEECQVPPPSSPLWVPAVNQTEAPMLFTTKTDSLTFDPVLLLLFMWEKSTVPSFSQTCVSMYFLSPPPEVLSVCVLYVVISNVCQYQLLCIVNKCVYTVHSDDDDDDDLRMVVLSSVQAVF